MALGPTNFGAIEFIKADQHYVGSRYADVREAIFKDPYLRNDKGELPFEPPRFLDTLRGAFFGPNRFLQAARRTVLSRADLRWGEGGKGFTRIVHRFGLGLAGHWEITEDNDYGGYFRKGSRALVIARYSTGGPIRSPGPRAHAFALKLFPTTDPQHIEPLPTANIFLMDDIGGSFTSHVIDAEFVNAPHVSLMHDPKGVPIMFAANVVFLMTDRNPTERQIYPIADLGEEPGAPTRAPLYMRIKADEATPRQALADGRDELLAYIRDPNDASVRRPLVFNIDVTNDLKSLSILKNVKQTFSNWKRIGRLTFDDAVASYNVDHVLHFTHPVWRDDCVRR